MSNIKLKNEVQEIIRELRFLEQSNKLESPRHIVIVDRLNYLDKILEPEKPDIIYDKSYPQITYKQTRRKRCSWNDSRDKKRKKIK